MSAAVISAQTGKVRQLDRPAESDERATPDQMKDPDLVSQLFLRILRNVSRLLRRWNPRRLDIEDMLLDATGTTLFRFEHKFGGRVRFWVVDWVGASPPNLIRDAATTKDVLVVTSSSSGYATIRIEEAG